MFFFNYFSLDLFVTTNNTMHTFFSVLFLAFISTGYSNKSAAEIYVNFQKMHALKRVLYIAAHPDDENTRALAWFSLGEKAETAYLSLTRGDGGQNLIGDELSEDLGALRTQELLAARSIDHATQFFSRAVDFGYSKSAEETFKKWGKDEILSDVVLIIRKFKPDVIITRFPPDERAGHGHHTASALLAIEAFEKANDPTFLPAQVAEYGTWKTTALYWNSSVWWDDDIADKAANNPDYFVQDIGGYNSLLGMSYNEIGTLARSQHKCQGFGAIIERGSRLEYFERLAGKKIETSFFENNTKTWNNLVNDKFANRIDSLLNHFNFAHVEQNVPALLSLQSDLTKLEDSPFKTEKLTQCNQLIIDCLGLYLEYGATDFAFSTGTKLENTITLINRSTLPVSLAGVYDINDKYTEVNKPLPPNQEVEYKVEAYAPKTHSNLYWLNKPFSTLFTVERKADLGAAESQATFQKKIRLKIAATEFSTTLPLIYKWREPDFGERRRTVIATPKMTVNFDEKSIIIKPGQTKTIQLSVRSFEANLTDELKINAPNGWTVSPKSVKINTKNVHEETWVTLTVSATEKAERGILKCTSANGTDLKTYTEIAYNHIPTQAIFKPAELVCVPLDAQIIPGKIAYIKGAGDAVPAAINQLGFEVKTIEVADLSTLDLTAYSTVVLGIRIYNVSPELANFNQKLFDYVEQGGNLIMQYNTASRGGNDETYGPLPFKLSRDRVTEEDAAVTFLAPEHPIMNHPNKLTQADFNDWVQERGLYFAQDWDKAYTPLFAWHDSGEDDVKGGLIVANYGKGQFIYTGISFFRELPNGVEGAYRLFANLLSYQP